ncbi:hypothetical protein ACFQ0M_08000 [Kitasatospora aburaviensis]
MNLAKNGKIYEYYRCAKTAGKPACKGQSVKGERVTAAITALVERLAGLAMTVRRFIPGEDHTEQLNHVTQAMRDLREEKLRNLFDYPGGDDEYPKPSKSSSTNAASPLSHNAPPPGLRSKPDGPSPTPGPRPTRNTAASSSSASRPAST